MLHCNFTVKDDSHLDFLLKNLNYTERLSLVLKPSDNYCPSDPMLNFNLKHLYILPSFWIKRDHLLAMNCKYLILEESKFSNQDINFFVKHWMNGGCPELKELLFTVEVIINYEVVLEAIEYTAIEGDRNYVDNENSMQTIGDSFDIKRLSDGVRATISDCGEDTKEFWMVVWPDSVGNAF